MARRSIRMVVTFNRTHSFIDNGQEPGGTVEPLKLFEQDLNEVAATAQVETDRKAGM